MSAAIDAPRPPRPGEELDLERLGPWLRSALGAPADAPVVVEQFPGGPSNLTYAVTVGDRRVVLRRPPFGSKVKSAHDMGREVRVLSPLAPVYSRALFAEALGQFPDRAELCVVRLGRVAVAGALLMHGHGATEVPSSSSLRECDQRAWSRHACRRRPPSQRRRPRWRARVSPNANPY